jgi:lysophospholipase L1-like esterase
MSQYFLTNVGVDAILMVDATAGNETVSLPQGLRLGRKLTVRRKDSSVNSVTVAPPSGLALNGVTDGTLTVGADSEVVFVALETASWESLGLTPARLAQDPALTGTYAGRLQTKIRSAAARAAARNALLLGPMSSPPALTTASTTNATGLGIGTAYRPAASAANLAKYRICGGIGQVYASSNYTAWSYTMGDGTNGNTLGDATRQSYQIAFEWVTDSPWFQIQQLARTAGFMLYVDDQQVSGGTLATSTNYGGTSFTLVDWSVGSATITASGAVFTTPGAHGLQVGDAVYLGAITTTTGVTANIPYFVLSTPSTTTFTLSATLGGSALTLTGDGSTARVAKAVTRKYRLEFNAGALLQLDLQPTASLYPPQEDTLRVVTVGDSIDSMTGSSLPTGGWQFIAGKLLGWTDVRAVSFGGTGFTTAAAHANKFGDAQRVADVVAHNPDMLVITISQNDTGDATLQAAALAAFQAYRTALPLVPIVMVGVDASSTGASAPSAARLATDTFGKAAFDQWADSNSFFIPNSSDPAGAWFTGTGYAGAKTGVGNRDIYGSDAAHPNDAGHKYIATRFAASFRRLVLPALTR